MKLYKPLALAAALGMSAGCSSLETKTSEQPENRPPMIIEPHAIEPNVPVKEWSVDVLDEAGKPVKTFTGTGVAPKQIRFEDSVADEGTIRTKRPDGTIVYFKQPTKSCTCYIEPRNLEDITRSDIGRVFEDIYIDQLELEMGADEPMAHNISELCELARLKNNNRYLFQNAKDILSFVSDGGTLAYARDFVNITNPRGEFIFTPREISELKKAEIKTKDISELASLRNNKGEPLFSDARSVTEYFDSGQDVAYANSLMYLKNFSGLESVDGRLVTWFARSGIDLERAEELSKLIDTHGKPLLTAFEIGRYAQIGIPPTEIVRFRDTKKPNALVVMPTNDWNEAFQSNLSTQLVNRIRELYDTRVIFASKESDVYAMMGQIPNIELLVLGGHGNNSSMKLGAGDSEESQIDTGDSELETYLRELNPNATIFLHGCSTAQDSYSEKKSLANFIDKMTKKIDGGKIKIIASRNMFSQGDVEIKSIYPFRIKIDGTFTNE